MFTIYRKQNSTASYADYYDIKECLKVNIKSLYLQATIFQQPVLHAEQLFENSHPLQATMLHVLKGYAHDFGQTFYLRIQCFQYSCKVFLIVNQNLIF